MLATLTIFLAQTYTLTNKYLTMFLPQTYTLMNTASFIQFSILPLFHTCSPKWHCLSYMSTHGDFLTSPAFFRQLGCHCTSPVFIKTTQLKSNKLLRSTCMSKFWWGHSTLRFSSAFLTTDEDILNPMLQGANRKGISSTIGAIWSSDIAVTLSNPAVPGWPRMASDVTTRLVETGMVFVYLYPFTPFNLK